MAKVLLCAPTLAFGDVRQDGDCGTSNLARQPEYFFFREILCQRIDLSGKRFRFLPNNQVAECRAHPWLAFPASCVLPPASRLLIHLFFQTGLRFSIMAR